MSNLLKHRRSSLHGTSRQSSGAFGAVIGQGFMNMDQGGLLARTQGRRRTIPTEDTPQAWCFVDGSRALHPHPTPPSRMGPDSQDSDAGSAGKTLEQRQPVPNHRDDPRRHRRPSHPGPGRPRRPGLAGGQRSSPGAAAIGPGGHVSRPDASGNATIVGQSDRRPGST